HLDGVRVAGRRSAYVFKGKHDDLREIGSRLNVEAVVEGSVQRAADRTHVTVELNRTRDGFTIWSQTSMGQPTTGCRSNRRSRDRLRGRWRASSRLRTPPPATPKRTLYTWKRVISGTNGTFLPN